MQLSFQLDVRFFDCISCVPRGEEKNEYKPIGAGIVCSSHVYEHFLNFSQYSTMNIALHLKVGDQGVSEDAHEGRPHRMSQMYTYQAYLLMPRSFTIITYSKFPAYRILNFCPSVQIRALLCGPVARTVAPEIWDVEGGKIVS